MFSFVTTIGLASDTDKFKINITLRLVQKFGDTGLWKNFNEDNSSFARYFKLDKFNMPCSFLKKHCNAAPGAKIWRYGTLEKF